MTRNVARWCVIALRNQNGVRPTPKASLDPRHIESVALRARELCIVIEARIPVAHACDGAQPSGIRGLKRPHRGRRRGYSAAQTAL